MARPQVALLFPSIRWVQHFQGMALSPIHPSQSPINPIFLTFPGPSISMHEDFEVSCLQTLLVVNVLHMAPLCLRHTSCVGEDQMQLLSNTTVLVSSIGSRSFRMVYLPDGAQVRVIAGNCANRTRCHWMQRTRILS